MCFWKLVAGFVGRVPVEIEIIVLQNHYHSTVTDLPVSSSPNNAANARFSLNLPEDITSHLLPRPRPSIDSLSSRHSAQDPSGIRTSVDNDSLMSVETTASISPYSHLASENAHLQRLLGHLRDCHDLDPVMNAEENEQGASIISSPLSTDSKDAAASDTAQPAKAAKKQTPEARAAVCAEILSTERTYVRELVNLSEVYVKELENSDLLTPQECGLIFSNVKSILMFHRE